MLEMIEKIDIVIATCELGLLNANLKIRTKAKNLLNKAIAVKHIICHGQLEKDQINAIDFLMVSWAKESCEIQMSNPMSSNLTSSETDSV